MLRHPCPASLCWVRTRVGGSLSAPVWAPCPLQRDHGLPSWTGVVACGVAVSWEGGGGRGDSPQQCVGLSPWVVAFERLPQGTLGVYSAAPLSRSKPRSESWRRESVCGLLTCAVASATPRTIWTLPLPLPPALLLEFRSLLLVVTSRTRVAFVLLPEQSVLQPVADHSLVTETPPQGRGVASRLPSAHGTWGQSPERHHSSSGLSPWLWTSCLGIRDSVS